MANRLCGKAYLLAAALVAYASPGVAAGSDLGMQLTDVDIRFNRAANALKENLQLTLETCNTAEKSVCHYRVNDDLAIVATAPGPGRNLERLVAIYINSSGQSFRQAVLMNELIFAMTAPDLSARERVGFADGLLSQLGRMSIASVTVDRIRYRLEVTYDKSLFLYVEAAR